MGGEGSWQAKDLEGQLADVNSRQHKAMMRGAEDPRPAAGTCARLSAL